MLPENIRFEFVVAPSVKCIRHSYRSPSRWIFQKLNNDSNHEHWWYNTSVIFFQLAWKFYTNNAFIRPVIFSADMILLCAITSPIPPSEMVPRSYILYVNRWSLYPGTADGFQCTREVVTEGFRIQISCVGGARPSRRMLLTGKVFWRFWILHVWKMNVHIAMIIPKMKTGWQCAESNHKAFHV